MFYSCYCTVTNVIMMFHMWHSRSVFVSGLFAAEQIPSQEEITTVPSSCTRHNSTNLLTWSPSPLYVYTPTVCFGKYTPIQFSCRLCLCICVCVCVCARARVCVCLCVCVCVHLCIFVYVYIRACGCVCVSPLHTPSLTTRTRRLGFYL